MKNTLITMFTVALLVGCSSTGIVPMNQGTYLIVKKGAQLGFGPPVGIKGEVYSEANAHCASESKAVETIKIDETNSGFGRSAAVSLEFRCVDKHH
jgi:hypothetical protein